MAKSNFKVHFARNRCKACGICIAFCPGNVFTMAVNKQSVVSFPDQCTGCKKCELYCPDFCIFVEEVHYDEAQADAGK